MLVEINLLELANLLLMHVELWLATDDRPWRLGPWLLSGRRLPVFGNSLTSSASAQ